MPIKEVTPPPFEKATGAERRPSVAGFVGTSSAPFRGRETFAIANKRTEPGRATFPKEDQNPPFSIVILSFTNARLGEQSRIEVANTRSSHTAASSDRKATGRHLL